jgi:hypothetical protein
LRKERHVSIYIDPKGMKHKVNHILADGRRVDDISGHPVPYNEEFVGVYQILEGIADRILRESREETSHAEQKGA